MNAYSLNEIEGMCKKAARGAGYDWGMAEELGRAARWLSARGLDGAFAAHSLLTRVDRADMKSLRPDPSLANWHQPGQSLCSLALGCALMDRGHLLGTIAPLNFELVHAPLIMVALIGQTSEVTKTGYALRWNDVHICTGDFGLKVKGNDVLAASASVSFTLSDEECPQMPIQDGIPIDAQVWQPLKDFADRTFAPATEESRLRGAGSDLPDID